MVNPIVKEINQKDTWEKFVLSFDGANFLQSYNWGEFHQRLGKFIKRLGFYDRGKLLGVMLSIKEDAKRATYLTIPGGPLIDFSNEALVKLFKKTLLDSAKEQNCSFIRIRPQLLENEENALIFGKLGFKNAPMHLHAELTRQLDLTKTEEELLSEMRKTTRYEIKQAIKSGIKITVSKNIEDIDDFYKLQKETAKRQGFVEFDKKFLKEQFKVFAQDRKVLLFTAYLGTKMLAQAFIIFYGQEADYHYGASTPDGRIYPGAYLIQWGAIKEAKKRGMKRYNLWGVAPEDQKNHRFYGVSVFKRGFGGEDVQYMHARDLVIDPLKYKLNWLVETVRRKVRHV
ncbi:peptidoglycan bridge formation glycyltransferase FemA/FemB family protein [Candidatus Daviesbacteria bacterium]|nr:peptidoglycan bridge formation glycyltransferase FemA/FemB family protein [Candidatus Daviesbacteria bacterium]